MATTTNYGWTTPDDTALVKDGASAIRTLGSAIDTTTKNLNPSTTLGDIEYRSATANTNTRVPIGTSGQALTVVAGVPSWQPSATSVLTTTGDLLFASAANTLARRAIGSTGDVLTVSGGLPTWAAPASGGMTLISTTTLSGATTTISSIPTTYVDLVIITYGVTGNTSNQRIMMSPNNVTNESNISVAYNGGGFSNNSGKLFLSTDATLRSNSENVSVTRIFNYNSTAMIKAFSIDGYFVDINTNRKPFGGGGAITTTSAITSLVFDYGGTNTFAGGTVLLYGVK